MTIILDPRNLPYGIHADTYGPRKNAYPTHTHGLNDITLPEIFINATCFGPVDNAICINTVVSLIAADDKLLEKIHAKETLELQLAGNEHLKICIRPVESTHKGVIAAYPTEDQRKGLEFAQMYVKGDDHVLDEDYFSEALDRSLNPPKDSCTPDCACYKHEDGE